MTGYFSRLLQQTGIAIGPTDGSRSAAPDRQLLKSKISDVTPSMYEEAKEGFQRSTQGSESEKMISSEVEERIEERLPQELQRQRTQMQGTATFHDQPEPVIRKISESTRQVSGNRSLESDSRQHGIEEIPGVNGDEFKNLYTEQVHQPSKHSAPADKKYTISNTLRYSDITSHEKTRQAYLKDVIEWVSGTSASDDEKTKHSEEIEAEKRKTSSISGDILKVPEIISEKQHRYEPTTPDFHLSIGTISVTVEKPQEKIQNKEPHQIIKVESKSRRENESSRLSRHYIRI